MKNEGGTYNLYDDFATNVTPHDNSTGCPKMANNSIRLSPFAFVFCPFLIRQIRSMFGVAREIRFFFLAENLKHVGCFGTNTIGLRCPLKMPARW